ncbi:MAG: hypothetical protein U0989_11425 [Azonexus sp.]|nr:hypothetical protein [Azonexus sp.]
MLPIEFHNVIEQMAGRKNVSLHLHFAGFNFRQVKDVVDQFKQLLA